MRELNARLRASGMTDDDARQLPGHLDDTMLAAADISTWMTDAGGFDVLPGLIGADGLPTRIWPNGRPSSAVQASRSELWLWKTSSTPSRSSAVDGHTGG